MRDDEYEVVKPEGMSETAVHKPGRIPWCPPGAWTGRVTMKVSLLADLRRPSFELGSNWLDSLEQICQWADDPTWQRQATYVVQAVMNHKNVSQAEAVEKIRKWTAQNKQYRDKESREPTDEERFAFSDKEIVVYKPAAGVATAKIDASIPWCDVAGKPGERWKPQYIANAVNEKFGIQRVIEGALQLCQRPKDPTWKTVAGYALQRWMNWTRQSQAEAVASFRARIQVEKFASEREELCKKLEVSPEASGEAKAYGNAHRAFFGCTSDNLELWRLDRDRIEPSLSFYYDADEELDSEVLRLVWLYSETSNPRDELPSKDPSENTSLLYYAVASQDFAAIDMKALATMTSKPPFNTSYARALVSENVSLLKWRQSRYEAAIDSLVKSGGDEYAKILRSAPKKGFADWRKVTEPWKAELQRSRAFEKKLSDPSRKVLAGCSAELFPDAEKLIKSYKKYEYSALVNQITSDPIAALLLSRLAVCFGYEKVFGGAGAMSALVKKGRDLRGPRSMAYYAIIDMLSETLKDRPGLLVDLTNFRHQPWTLIEMYEKSFDLSGSLPYDPEKDASKGFVKGTRKTDSGLEIEFKQTKYTYPELSCRDTRKPIRIRSDGSIEYEQYCVETGKMLSQDSTPKPGPVHPFLAAGLTPGAYAVVTTGPVVAFTKKKPTDKTIVTFFGFSL